MYVIKLLCYFIVCYVIMLLFIVCYVIMLLSMLLRTISAGEKHIIVSYPEIKNFN